MPHRSDLEHYQCQTCEWFQFPGFATRGSVGSCHYKAPDATGETETAFPLVKVDDWCRHHSMRYENRPEDVEDE